MSKCPMRGHFRYLRFKTFPMTPRTPQCEVFWVLLSSSKHSGVPEDSKSPTFPSVGLHPHTWPKWGCDTLHLILWKAIVYIWCGVGPYFWDATYFVGEIVVSRKYYKAWHYNKSWLFHFTFHYNGKPKVEWGILSRMSQWNKSCCPQVECF
jgi:hypothetical protein